MQPCCLTGRRHILPYHAPCPEAVLMEPHEAVQPAAFPIPQDWRRYPELIPALRILVEGARRVALTEGALPQRKPTDNRR
jgi:hypothetical protein